MKEDQKKKSHRAASRWIAGISLICAMTFSLCANAASWILQQMDSPEPVSEEQLDVFERRAHEGDWNLKTEFAAAFFYGDCDRLKYGHRCRAMASRKTVGAAFLREVLDTEPSSLQRTRVASFQENYAYQRYSDATPNYDPASKACQDAVRYAGQALNNGNRCIANLVGMMYSLGHCFENDMGQAATYYKQAAGCPTP